MIMFRETFVNYSSQPSALLSITLAVTFQHMYSKKTGKTSMELKPRDHALQTQLYLHVATAESNAQLDAYAPLISLDNSALHTLVPVTGTRGAWTAIHHTHS